MMPVGEVWLSLAAGGRTGAPPLYRGTSLIRNSLPPRTTIGP